MKQKSQIPRFWGTILQNFKSIRWLQKRKMRTETEGRGNAGHDGTTTRFPNAYMQVCKNTKKATNNKTNLPRGDPDSTKIPLPPRYATDRARTAKPRHPPNTNLSQTRTVIRLSRLHWVFASASCQC